MYPYSILIYPTFHNTAFSGIFLGTGDYIQLQNEQKKILNHVELEIHTSDVSCFICKKNINIKKHETVIVTACWMIRPKYG